MPYSIENLESFPTAPGVYMMKDDEGVVLYVGKAKNLKARVKQYFVPGRDGRLMVPFLVAKVADIETIVVFSEKEALLLESNLIKQYRPRYNALLKDDKSYIALKLSINDRWPKLSIVRYRGTPEPDGLYFGPYTSSYAAKQTLELLNRLFPLRQCSDQELARGIPCLLYQMKRCVGPCANKCTKEEYQEHIERTIKFLKGQDKEVLKDLYQEMERRSQNLEFEKAEQILRTIRYLEKTIEAQHVDRPLGLDVDALGIYRQGDEVILSQLIFRSGRLVASRQFNFNKIAEEDEELLETFILQHYKGQKDGPIEILLTVPLGNQSTIEDLLATRHERKIYLHAPQRGEKKTLLDMAVANAEAAFQRTKNQADLRAKALSELQGQLNLIHYPHRIECFDNAHLGGSAAVAAMVTFIDGKPDKKRYRTYNLRSIKANDDYGAMYEALTRRYQKAKETHDFPDLLIVDGGKGQLNIALRVFAELQIEGVDIIGLAKEEGRHDKGMSAEQIFLPHQTLPLLLKLHAPALLLLQQIRDEAHRVAITIHRNKRSKATIKSLLENVPGIGPAKRTALLKQFGSLKNIKVASDDELRQVKGLTSANIAAIRAYFQD